MVFLDIAANMQQAPNASDSKDRPSDVELREAADKEEGDRKTGHPSRANNSRSKLRSLFDLRKGEVAALSIPAETMKQLLLVIPPDGPEKTGDANPDTPGMAGVFGREMLLPSLQSAERPIRGVVNHESDFELKAGDISLSGSGIELPDHTGRLLLRLTAGSNSIECLTRVPAGHCVLLSSGGENPEGVLIVTGPRGEPDGAEK